MKINVGVPSRLYQEFMPVLEEFIQYQIPIFKPGKKLEISGGGWTHTDSRNMIAVTLESDDPATLFLTQGFCLGYIRALIYK